MENHFFAYVRPIVRWSWVTAVLVAATVYAIMHSHANEPLVYVSTVTFQVSVPEPEEVTLFTQTRTGTAHEEISAVQNNFISIAKGSVAAQMTIQALGLKMTVPELLDRITPEIPNWSDLVRLHAHAENPQDAEAIARVHAESTLKYYGEARARTTVVRRQFIAAQLQAVGKDVASAREALLRFQVASGTADLTRDIQGYQDTLRSLRLDRDRNNVEMERATAAASYYTALAQKAATENDAVAAASYRASAAANQAIVEGLRASTARLNEVIAQRENELLSLVGLSAEYDRIRTELQRVENNYNFLQSKLQEAQMKEADARSAGFIQMIEPATLPTRPQRVQTRNLLIPGVAASLLGGVVLSFILEFIFGRARRRTSSQT